VGVVSPLLNLGNRKPIMPRSRGTGGEGVSNVRSETMPRPSVAWRRRGDDAAGVGDCLGRPMGQFRGHEPRLRRGLVVAGGGKLLRMSPKVTTIRFGILGDTSCVGLFIGISLFGHWVVDKHTRCLSRCENIV
jgi:hypothetical protein